MSEKSLVLEIPAADGGVAHDHFARKLALETDPSDVHTDLKNGIKGFVLLDVRSTASFAQSHAQGAISLPHPEITPERIKRFTDDEVLVVYCWGPGCNGADKAALKLSALGKRVKIMIGGYEYWAKEGYPLEK
ncbi:MAG: rhodanese-like domain-containing protein [Thermodesulfobacteriota bacterium]